VFINGLPCAVEYIDEKVEDLGTEDAMERSRELDD
jgi:hypothetical protein